jgi:hypothetical protein
MTVTDDLTQLVLDALCQPVPAIGYWLSREVSRRFPDMALFEGSMPPFNVEAFAAEGLCHLTERLVPYPYRLRHWQPDIGTISRVQVALFDVRWEGEEFAVLITHWPGDSGTYHYGILAATMQAAERFHDAVCTWNTRTPDEYILVFDFNGWNRDEALLAAIESATLDSVVLHGSLCHEIVADVTSFFAARETYAEYGIPWKRGILFVGPPGNGKTLLVKSLVNMLDQKCIYVKTFAAGGPDQMGIHAIFERARAMAPCVIVLEDLDSLITPNNRSYFLNEMDGFAGNEGVLTLATTNHPERLDPAILDRPSRFDRKYPFMLPEREERRLYIARWNETLRPAVRLSAGGVERMADETDDFSFAYLKELFISSLMRWIAVQVEGGMDAVMGEQVAMLRDHMAYIGEPPVDLGSGGVPEFGGRWGRGARHRGLHGHVGPQGEFPM